MIEQDTSSILALISRIHSSTADFLAKKLSEQGLEDMTSSYGNILFRLSLEKKLTMSDLAKKINRNKSTLTVLVRNLEKEGFETIAVGKINDIFDGYGVSKAIRTVSNHDGMLKTIEIAKTDFEGLCFVNLVDFDALYGHRRDLIGYKNAIEEFDTDLNELLNIITEDDLIMVTADHGNDPVHHGTDHTRENVPLICYHKNIKGNVLEDADSFATVAATICDNFNVKMPKIGKSILGDL